MFLSAPAVNETKLDDLLWEITRSLALLIVVGGTAICWMIVFEGMFNRPTFLATLALMAAETAVYKVGDRYQRLARYLFIWAITAWLCSVLLLNHESWWIFLGLPTVMASIILLSSGAVPSVTLFVVTVMVLALSGERDYSLFSFIGFSFFTGVLSWVTVQTLYVTLHWTMLSEQHASALLEETRKNRAEILVTLKSLERSNTALRRAEIELRNAYKEAENARQLKEQFAANISHELRTPLNLILGFSEVMHLTPEVYEAADWPSTLQGDIYQVYRSSCHLLEMIDDILDLSRFQMSSFKLNREPTPVATILNEGLDIAKDLFRGRQVEFRVDLADNLPIVRVDKTRIRQVILNLINNAYRFTEIGYVKLSAWADARQVYISVTDTGPGIAADKVPFIFEEFYQADSSLNRSHGGTGLGLTISKKFVESHGGEIGVKSEVGAGSVFTFTIPIIDDDASTLLQPPDEADAEPENEVKPVVLVVDPDPSVAALVQRHLRNCEIVPVESAAQVDKSISEHYPDLVIVNTMPQANDRVGSMLPLSVPCIECSLPSRSWVLAELNVAASFIKPVNSRDLIQAVHDIGPVHDVLIIDDDPGFAQLVERILQTAGQNYVIRSSHASERALQQMRLKAPDVLLLDLTMPDINGVRILEFMHDCPELADVPVILLSATNFAEDLLANHGSRIAIQHRARISTPQVLEYIRALSEVIHK
ncbi:hybrid sensor histidine kinase/response regulator [Aggregatilinea lenta]|uniref:hybrid sensor histidine kinase/response regulator n=1 Tax=Aggregatilinea lenta TaxID=913108 RepID=UPI000E5A4564|nr:hybrid sensor histidine kinase/response regulator [Aggregatilinea lenta]